MYFDEHMTYDYNADNLANAGSKALGSVINKLKLGDCMTYDTYSKCVNSCVCPVIDYGSEIIGVYKNVKTRSGYEFCSESLPRGAYIVQRSWLVSK